MNGLSTVEATLPPGFRFHPRDEELICDYLMRWVARCSLHTTPFLIQVDLNKCEPWDIPETACVGGKDWYFYSQRDRKYATGLRTNRATLSGYWKATGKDRPIIIQKRTLVGMRKTLVFYHGRAPKGRKTDWVMHEFRLEGGFGPHHRELSSYQEKTQQDWVLCRVFRKNTCEAPAEVLAASDSSSSPALTDIPYSSSRLNKIQTVNHNIHEQVPCFSMFQPSIQTQMDIPPIGGIYAYKQTHISRSMESFAGNYFCFGEGISEANLSALDLPPVWN